MLNKIIRSHYYLMTVEDDLFIYTDNGELYKTGDIERAEIWNKETVKDAYKKCKDYGIDCKVVLMNIIYSREDY